VVDYDAEGSFHDRIFFSLLMLIGWVVLWQRQDRLRDIVRNNVFLFVFFGYMGLSVFWSEETASFKRLIKVIGDLTMALVVATETKSLQAALTVIRRTSYLLIPLSVILVKYFRALGTKAPAWIPGPNMWIGVTTHKNSLGELCLFAGIVLLLECVRTWRNKHQVLRLPFVGARVDVFYGVMLAYLLYGDGHSKSTTSFLVLAFAAGLFFLLEYQHRRSRQIVPVRFVFKLLLIGLIVHFSTVLIFNKTLYMLVVESQGKDPTLAGRSELWEDLFIMGQPHALFGSGYGGFWTHEAREKLIKRHLWGPNQAHNGYIEIWLQLGFVGLLLFALVIGHALYGMTPLFKNRQDVGYGMFRLIILLVTLLHNYSEGSFSRPTYLVWFIFLIVVINSKEAQSYNNQFQSREHQRQQVHHESIGNKKRSAVRRNTL
jgi:O-antigen ligase